MGREYNMNLTKRYKVTFIKDGTMYKSGEEVMVGMPLASKFYAEDKIEATSELVNDAKALGCEKLFTKRKKTNS
jgi:hypothetical protein